MLLIYIKGWGGGGGGGRKETRKGINSQKNKNGRIPLDSFFAFG